MFNKFRKVFILAVGVATFGLFQSVNADWNAADGDQDIMISLQSNPMSDPERACLAVTFARMLSKNPAANVTLFVTLDGVTLADESVASSRRFKCETPWDPDGISLQKSLEIFIDSNDNNMVVCPICWKSRYGDELPDYGVLPGVTAGVPGTAIGTMIFNADKILDF